MKHVNLIIALLAAANPLFAAEKKQSTKREQSSRKIICTNCKAEAGQSKCGICKTYSYIPSRKADDGKAKDAAQYTHGERALAKLEKDSKRANLLITAKQNQLTYQISALKATEQKRSEQIKALRTKLGKEEPVIVTPEPAKDNPLIPADDKKVASVGLFGIGILGL